MRVFRVFFVALLLVSAGWPAFAAKYASIVVDTGTGAVLHAENPDERAYPASLTKMMTLYLVFEALKAKTITMDKLLPVSAYAAGRPPSKLGLRKGQTIAVRDVIGALITKSANDAASVVAEALGGTEARFAQMMTVRARKLGMSRTTFRNASGLPDSKQMSTARDMARLSIALQRDFPEYYGLFATASYDFGGQSYRNHNRLLTAYAGTDGIKTGYIRASGFNIAVSVERQGRRLIAVVFGGKSAARRDRHTAQLLTDAFASLFDGNRPVRPLPALVADAHAADVGETVDDRGGAGAQEAAETTVASAAGDIAVGDAQEGSAEAPPPDEWAVQVGAFNRYAPAHLAATRAAGELPVLVGLRVVVVPSKTRKNSLYRARLVGLDREKARDACRELRERKFQCLAIKHETSLAVAQ